MFDVRRSSFKTTPFGINATCEWLQNNLALMPQDGPSAVILWMAGRREATPTEV